MKRLVTIPFLTLLAFASLGCADILKVPAFNPHARLANRIASAKEVCGQMYLEVSELVSDQVITQDFANKSINPRIDDVLKSANEAQSLYDAGKLGDAATKYQATETTLKAVRDILAQLRKEKS